jgi:hypothetical protein
MWVFTTYGFFSAVLSREAHDEIMIRGRSKPHLLNLRDRFFGHLKLKVKTSTGTDYKYRIIVPRHEWILAAGRLAAEVNYNNFKSAVEEDLPLDTEYIDATHRVWSVMYQIQK